jgi:hypothetical protein
MAKQNNPKPKKTSVGGLAGLSKARAEADKRIKAMTPAQRKAYQSQNKKNAIKATVAVASMIPAVRGARVAAAGVKAVRALKTVKLEKTAANLKKAPKSNVRPSQSKFTGVDKRERLGPRERVRLGTPSSEREKMALKYVKEQSNIRKAKNK